MAGGFPPMEVALQARLDDFKSAMDTAGQLADERVQSIEQSFKNLNPSISTNLLAGSIAGVLGGAAVEKFISSMIDANRQLAGMVDLADKLGVSLERLQQIKFAGASAGVSDDSMTSGLEGMNKLLNDAQRNENSLTKLLDENNIKYKDRNGTLITFNQMLTIAGQLISKAFTPADKDVIAGMLGLSKEVVAVWSQGPEQFENVAKSANGAGAVIDDATIKKAAEFTKQWDATAAKWATSMKASAADILPWIDKLIDASVTFAERVAAAAQRAGTLMGGMVAETLVGMRAASDEQLKMLAASNQPREVVPGVAVGNEAEFRAAATEMLRRKMEEDTKKEPLKLTVTPKISKEDATKIPTTRGTGSEANAFTRAEDAVSRHTAALNADAAAVGLDNAAHERLRVTAQLEEAAKRANIPLTEELTAKIAREADAAAAAADKLQKSKTAWEGLNESIRFGGNELVNVLDQATQKGANFGSIMQSVMRDVAKAMLQAAITGEGAFAKLFGMSSSSGGVGGLGGVLASLFSGSGAPNLSTAGVGAAGPSLGSFVTGSNASGTDDWRGGPTWVGENGPELLNLPKGSQIIPNDVANKMGGPTINITHQIDARGADPGAAAAIMTALRQSEARMKASIVPTVKQAYSRGIIR